MIRSLSLIRRPLEHPLVDLVPVSAASSLLEKRQADVKIWLPLVGDDVQVGRAHGPVTERINAVVEMVFDEGRG